MFEGSKSKADRIRSNIAAILAVVWMCVIFSFSAQTQEESGTVSLGFSYRMVDTAGRLFGLDLDYDKIRAIAGAIEHIVRKGAHMTEYAILAFLFYVWLCRWNISRRRRLAVAAVMAILYACSDELHQIFVAGRAGQISDVLVDSAGALLALLLILMRGARTGSKEDGQKL